MFRIYFFKHVSLRYFNTVSSDVRVRFAPSPTGVLHLGGLRTAFFNYLFARKNQGKFILRIEDTDRKRIKPGSREILNGMLEWSGIIPDESPEMGGQYGPYVQSERLQIYHEKADLLLKSGAAYRCFCSETRLEILRKEALHTRESRGYDNKCRHLDPSEIDQLLKEGKSYTIRFKIPEGPISHSDIVFGQQTYNVSENEGDFIILKSDGFPTYHFASVVDDHLMKISHVLRGTEWLISTPKHILLYQALNWQPPKFAHLPLLTNSDRSKLSKRQESIGIEYFKDKGYSPIALLNFLGVAGGGFGRQEGFITYDLPSLCAKFNLESVNTGSCIVDLRKLDIFNHNYLIQQLSDETSTAHLIQELRAILKKKYGKRYENEQKNLSDSYIKKILLCYKDRMCTLNHLTEPDMEYIWTTVEWEEISEKLTSLNISPSIVAKLKSVADFLSSLPNAEFTQDNLNNNLKNMSKDLNVPFSSLMRALRVVLTAQKNGPGVSEIIDILGKKRCLEKIYFVVEKSESMLQNLHQNKN
ncbi:probable glutamate--tRNA ligase, mitochondrial [Caerostris darwini]|uniref:Nondiscriminating glutamyl-tRNA synthetase EARS2, mitochondrial n=1 Tax=Caerostris darwini TaxID=1538125 RepID=A0AAV4T302_9ARAC|nr:probable glutamate--tRNA ligase, mitochondrial [Caerostris darwini]